MEDEERVHIKFRNIPEKLSFPSESFIEDIINEPDIE